VAVTAARQTTGRRVVLVVAAATIILVEPVFRGRAMMAVWAKAGFLAAVAENLVWGVLLVPALVRVLVVRATRGLTATLTHRAVLAVPAVKVLLLTAVRRTPVMAVTTI